MQSGRFGSSFAACPDRIFSSRPQRPILRQAFKQMASPARYQLLGKTAGAVLGEGSYGQVRPAWDLEKQQLVAIKAQPVDSDTAARELMLFHSVPVHPHLLAMLGMFVSGKELNLVFEYCILSLADMFRRAQGYIGWDGVRRYSEQVLKGIAHLHRSEVAHRDLSMSNVLIREAAASGEGTCVVADLGLAVSASRMVLDRVVTTCWYRAPEACFAWKESENIIQQLPLDMWSYGVLMTALFTGTHIFAFANDGVAPGQQPENHKLLKKICNAIGPPDQDWPHFAKWQEIAAGMEISLKPKPYQDRLQNSFWVRRTLEGWPKARELMASLVCWNPKSRLSAEDCLQHGVWSEGSSGGNVDSEPRTDSKHCAELGLVLPGCTNQLLACEDDASDANSKQCGSASADGPTSRTASELTDVHRLTGQSPKVSGNLCMCSGSCGNRNCMKRKRARYQEHLSDSLESEMKVKKHRSGGICDSFNIGPKSEYCNDCLCIVLNCGRPRTGQRQLCLMHGRERNASNKQTCYMNQRGLQMFDPRWSPQLRLVAIHSWMLRDMTPCDLNAFFAGADELVGCATKVDGRDLLNLYSIAALKLPSAIATWLPLAVGSPIVSDGGPAAVPPQKLLMTATDFADASVKMASIVSSIDATWEVQQLQTGSQNLLLGPSKFCHLLGMCKTPPTPEAKANATKYLGCIEALASASRCEDVWEDLVKAADQFDQNHPDGLEFPRTAEETQTFLDEVTAFLCSFPSKFGHGPDGKDTKVVWYVRKHVVRKVLLWIRRRTPKRIWHMWKVSDIRKFTPDKCDLLSTLADDMTLDNVEARFGVDGFMLACWACLFKGVNARYYTAFVESTVKLQQKMKELRDRNSGQEPILNTLAREFLSP